MSSTNTESTENSTRFNSRQQWATRSRLHTSSSVPTYQTFLERLQNLDTGTLAPGSACPICRIPFTELQAHFNNKGSEHQQLLALETLPFHNDTGIAQFDRPVRLPCTAQHVVGRVCIMSWASEGRGTTCPLDREELFTIGSEETNKITNDEDRFRSGVRHISQMTIRHLLQRFRNVTESDMVTVNARSMTTRLATLIFRTVFQSYSISEAVTARWKWPRIRRPLYNQEAQNFQHIVKHFIKTEPLTDSGQYPAHIITLLNPALPHVFALLYRLARFFQAQTIPLCDLAYTMREHLKGFFSDFSYTITAEKALKAITFKTIDLWVTQELLMTELRTATNQANEWDDTMARGVRYGDSAHVTLFETRWVRKQGITEQT
ncbi:uncharacterized protein N0V89_012341 [Didymosphaeria variabile]|uniref:RING-type domain-containing protein n=1 Tax=Didymosphaeria variabile TaxID=1932322 RepID=A0A9W8X8Z5_9PLEO|nr:uncharacterized protein N0V89_012341 [Didymosphaeria variabile]KAJ4344597.1 hypothetical protein N0V89_012341 [Didymosphaeria variabile]